MESEPIMEALGRLYEAVIAPEGMADALNALGDSFGASECCLLSIDKAANRLELLDTGQRLFSSEAYRDYRDHFVQIDEPRLMLETTPAGSVFSDVDHFSEERVNRSEYYQDFLRRYGSRFIFGTNLINDRKRIAGVSLHRGPATGGFASSDRELLARAIPHLRRITLLRLRLFDLEGEVSLSRAALDRLSFGLATTDAAGRLVLTNARFEAALALGDGLALRNRAIDAATPRATSALAAAIAAAARASAGKGSRRPGSGLRLPRPSGRKPWAIAVVPLPVRSDLARQASPGALLVLGDLDALRETPLGQLVDLFGLTPGEARLVERLLHAGSLAAAAELNGTTIGTARHVLKQVFHKTDTHSQAELVKRVLRSPVGRLDED
jgi:hypothetical protein